MDREEAPNDPNIPADTVFTLPPIPTLPVVPMVAAEILLVTERESKTAADVTVKDLPIPTLPEVINVPSVDAPDTERVEVEIDPAFKLEVIFADLPTPKFPEMERSVSPKTLVVVIPPLNTANELNMAVPPIPTFPVKSEYPFTRSPPRA